MLNKKEENPLVSVILPTYNRSSILSRSIRSVLKQTYQNIELIVVDDASTDQTRKILENFKKKDKRIRCIFHNKKLGGAIARNTGIKNSKGKYMAFIDSDDEWLSSKLKLQMSVFKNNVKIDVVYCGFYFLNLASKNKSFIKKYLFKNRGSSLLKKILINEIIPPTSTILIKKKALLKVDCFTNIPAHQDYLLYIMLSNNGYYFDYVNKHLVKKIEEKDSISKNFMLRIEGRKEIINYISSNIIDRKLKCAGIISQYLNIFIFYMENKEFKKALIYFLKSIQNSYTIKVFFYVFISKINYAFLKKIRQKTLVV